MSRAQLNSALLARLHKKVGNVIPPFKFDSALATFTPAMAIRAGALFAGAPMVQGKFNGADTPDVLLCARGTQVSSNWYANFDPYQGTVVFFWTPEKSRDASQTQDEYLVRFDSNFFIRYEHDNGRIFAKLWQDAVVSYTTVAGAPVCIAISWDANNKIDGTNYIRFSINDVHTFTVTAQPVAAPPSANLYVGSDSVDEPANARIEGLTVYRRVLFDGTNGINVGNGDEINLIYNSGTFKDPCEVTGSWDVVFCLPTNATPGTLTTTGQAWTHPHLSNLVAAADGFMTNGTAWTNWTDIGLPLSEALLATAEKIFNWGYKFVTTAGGDGEEYTVTVVAGADWVIRAIIHSADPVDVILYDKSNGAEIGKLTSAGATTRTAPFVAIFTGEAPAGCISLGVRIQGTVVTQTVYCHQVELLANLLTNPSFATGAGDPWLPTGWTNAGLAAGDSEQEATIVHSGTSSLQYNVAADTGDAIRANPALSNGGFAGYGGWFYGTGVKGMQLRMENGQWSLQRALATNVDLEPGAASWTHAKAVARRTSVSANTFFLYGNAGIVYFDDAYMVALTAVTLTVTPASLANSTETSGIRVDGLDSLTQPVLAANLSNERIEVRFKYTPRHDEADVLKFGNATTPVIFYLTNDSVNFMRFTWNGANQLSVNGSASGVSLINTVQSSVSGIDAGVTYDVVFIYTKGVGVVVTFNGVEKYNKPVLASADFAALTAWTAYWGSRNNLDRQVDATFAALA